MALPSGEEDAVALDADLIKVLAADSRRDILRLLGERRMTLTEISHRLGLGKATVLEHLKRLVEAELVRRHEDERLWVYYELTRKGGRFVNPGRTRFYLLLAGSALALALGVALAVAMLGGDAPTQPPATEPDRGYVAVESAHAGSDGALSVRARVLSPGATSGSDLSVYLVSSDAARTLGSSSTPVQGIPLLQGVSPDRDAGTGDDVPSEEGEAPAGQPASDAESPPPPTQPTPATAPTTTSTRGAGTAEPLTLDLAARVALPPGAYYVAVVGPTGKPTLSDAPALVVPPVEAALSSPVAWRGVSGDVDVQLTEQGARVGNGTLALAAAGVAEPALRLPVLDGAARLSAAQLDALEPGRYVLAFHPAQEGASVRLAQALEVRDPRLALSPSIVPAGPDSTVALAMGGPASGSPVPVQLDGAPVANVSSEGTWRVSLPALAQGEHVLQVGRVANLTLHAEPRVVVELARAGNESTLLDVHGAPLSDVAVLVDGAPVSTTGANGTFVLPPSLPDGMHVLAFGNGSGSPARTLHVQSGNVTLAPVDVTAAIQPVPSGVPGELAFRVLLTNADRLDVRATLEVLVDDAPVEARAVDVPANGTTSVDVTLHGYAAGERAVRVVAKPFLSTVAPDEPAPAPAFAPGIVGGSTGAGGSSEDVRDEDFAYSATGVTSIRVAASPPSGFELLPDAQVIPRAPTGDAAASEPAAVPAPPVLLVLALVALVAWARRRRGDRR